MACHPTENIGPLVKTCTVFFWMHSCRDIFSWSKTVTNMEMSRTKRAEGVREFTQTKTFTPHCQQQWMSTEQPILHTKHFQLNGKKGKMWFRGGLRRQWERTPAAWCTCPDHFFYLSLLPFSGTLYITTMYQYSHLLTPFAKRINPLAACELFNRQILVWSHLNNLIYLISPAWLSLHIWGDKRLSKAKSM